MHKRIGVATPIIWNHPVLRRVISEALPDAIVHQGTHVMDEDELIAFLRGCDAAIIGFEPLTEKVLAALPGLKVVSKFGAGYESFDFHAMQRHGIRFGYTWGVNRLAVAELTLCFMIAALRWVPALNLAMRRGERPRYKNGRLLTGRVVGIHGCGNVGKEVARLLKPFNCTILATDINDYPEFHARNNVTPVSFETLLERSEVLTLHLPKTAATRGLYDRAALGKLRPDCVLVNTCRGGIVDEAALLERLESGALTAAGFDVFAVEPCDNDALLNHPNMLATPHIGASAEEIRLATVRAAIRGLDEHELVDPAKYYAE